MAISNERQSYLVDQGYAYKVVTRLPFPPNYAADQLSEEKLLADVKLAVSEGKINYNDEEEEVEGKSALRAKRAAAKKTIGTASRWPLFIFFSFIY